VPFWIFSNFYEQSLCMLRIFLRIIIISFYSVVIIVKFQFSTNKRFWTIIFLRQSNNLSCIKGILWISCTAIKHVKDIFLFMKCIVSKYVQVHINKLLLIQKLVVEWLLLWMASLFYTVSFEYYCFFISVCSILVIIAKRAPIFRLF